jgi:hypothetical protein
VWCNGNRLAIAATDPGNLLSEQKGNKGLENGKPDYGLPVYSTTGLSFDFVFQRRATAADNCNQRSTARR